MHNDPLYENIQDMPKVTKKPWARQVLIFPSLVPFVTSMPYFPPCRGIGRVERAIAVELSTSAALMPNMIRWYMVDNFVLDLRIR